MTKPLFTVRTQLLAAVAKWACQDDQRFHISHVLFDGKHMVATDGHRIVAVTCETGVEPFMLHRTDCAMLAAAQREITRFRTADLKIAVVDGKAEVDLDGTRRVIVKAHAKDFPPWDQLFASAKAETPAPASYSFQPQYLAAIDDVIQSVTGDTQRAVTVKGWPARESSGYAGPMLFESVVFDDGPGGYEMRFLIMPTRS